MDPVIIIALIIVAALAIAIIFSLFGFAFAGALHLLAYASEQGFVGIAVYIACWVFMLPVMLGVCIIIGWLQSRNEPA